MGFVDYIVENQSQVISLFIEHIYLTMLSVGLAILIGVPLGILICYVRQLDKPVLSFANVVQAIPSMALLGLFIPLLGIGKLPAVVTVILYSLLPIIKNTYTGISNINPQTLEAAKGIGLTRMQVLAKIQIPLALPVIMAGVRISSVTAVGLMTIAAFIGAGGLGYLVFSGIRTVNNAQILAGAIPACLLALAVDFAVAQIERIVTPRSLQKNRNTQSGGKGERVRRNVVFVGIAAAVVICFAGISLPKQDQEVVRIGSKDFSEQMILGHMVADLIEGRTDLAVERNVNLGGTQVCFSALKAGEIDLYIDYSGTGYGDILGYPPINDMDKVYDTVKKDFAEKFDLQVLKQMRFNNTYALAVRPDLAAKYGLKNISDLARIAPSLKGGTTLEFLNRSDGMPGVEKTYAFKLKENIGIDGSPRYVALDKGSIDVIDAFSTDGLLKKFHLVVLEDDKKFFPPYYAMPVARRQIIEKYPEIVPLLEELGNHITNEVMMELNYKVDELQMQPEKVAHQFLVEQKLISSIEK